MIGRALGVDFGTKRIGYALSDEMGWVAEPLEVWNHKDLAQDIAHLVHLVREHEVKRIVIGLPLHMSGKVGPSAERASEFIDGVRAALPELEVSARDEALTSWAAEEMLRDRGVKPEKRKKLLDAYAAAVILQEDLDSRRG
jgi:putative holliday junction resolvase